MYTGNFSFCHVQFERGSVCVQNEVRKLSGAPRNLSLGVVFVSFNVVKKASLGDMDIQKLPCRLSLIKRIECIGPGIQINCICNFYIHDVLTRSYF